MRLERLQRTNREAESRRPWVAEGYQFEPVGWHDEELHRLKSTYPYFGFVDVGVEGLGRFVMFSNDDDLVAQTYFWFGPNSYESLSVRIWRRLAERSTCIVDVGAFTGVFTLVAQLANPEAEVHAVEPIPRCVERLMINLRANRVGQEVEVHTAAAGAYSHRAEIRRYQDGLRISSAASLAARDLPERPALPAEVIALDDLQSRRPPDLFKIDVEFAEERVLSGLRRSLEQHRPTLLLEVTGPDRFVSCRELLPDYSLAIIDDEEQTWHLEEGGLFSGRRTRNVLCVPDSETPLIELLSEIPPLTELNPTGRPHRPRA